MTDQLRLHDDNDEVTRGLRELYAPPAAESYWVDLEARIMARVRQGDTAWWSELGQWARPALVAAAMIIVAAGLIVFRTNQEATQVAYEDVLAAPTPISVEGAARPAGLRGLSGQREETLYFLISY
jgi:hypothetical protein